jgi:hypothetical protein
MRNAKGETQNKKTRLRLNLKFQIPAFCPLHFAFCIYTGFAFIYYSTIQVYYILGRENATLAGRLSYAIWQSVFYLQIYQEIDIKNGIVAKNFKNISREHGRGFGQDGKSRVGSAADDSGYARPRAGAE